MRDALKKALSKLGVNENVQDQVSMEEFSQLSAKVVELTEQLNGRSSELSSVLEKLENTEAALTAALEQVAQFKEEAEVRNKQMQEEKLANREKAIVEAIGTARAPATLEAVEGLDDASFNAVLSAIKTSMKAEETAPEFTETGVSGQPEPSAPTETIEMRALKAKYNVN